MEVETSQPSAYKGRKFEFYDIEWVFENFNLASCQCNWAFETPEFTVRGFHTTKWLMTLKCEKGKDDTLNLSLKRCESDPGPDIVWVDWRISLHIPNSEQDSINKLSCFKKGSESNENLGNMASILAALKPFQSDLLKLQCKMLFFNEEASKGFQPCSNAGIRSLSENFLHLFQSGKDPDLELVFKNNSIAAHKIIACSRIKQLNFLIEQHGRKSGVCAAGARDVLDLSYLSYDGMLKIMAYAYSGDLKHVLAEPSLFIYDCIQKFSIPEIQSYYIPNEIYFRSSVNVLELNFTWIIPDKRKLMFTESIKSPVFTDDCSGTIWQLHLSPSDDTQTDYFALYVESILETEYMACFECGIADKNDSCFFVKRLRCPPQVLKTFGIEKFISVNVAKSFSEDNDLRVAAKLRLSNGAASTCIEKQNISFITCTPAERCYYLLSVHMESAYEAGFFSDLHLQINSIVYKVHKCIIAARSSKINGLVRQMSLDGVNPFVNFEPNIFCMLLRYLYSGVVMESEFEEDFVELYDTAMYFDLPLLRDLCSTYLQVLIQHNLVIRTKVLEISEKHHDEVLMESVKKYISEL